MKLLILTNRWFSFCSKIQNHNDEADIFHSGSWGLCTLEFLFGKTICFDLFYKIQSSLSAQPPPAQTDRLLWRKRPAAAHSLLLWSKNVLTLGEWVDYSLKAFTLNITALVATTRARVSNRWQCEASLSQTSNAAAAAYVICVLNLWQTSYFPGCITLAGWGFRDSITIELRISFHTLRQSRCKRGAFAVLKRQSLSFLFRPNHSHRWASAGGFACRIITHLLETLSKQVCFDNSYLWIQSFDSSQNTWLQQLETGPLVSISEFISNSLTRRWRPNCTTELSWAAQVDSLDLNSKYRMCTSVAFIAQ